MSQLNLSKRLAFALGAAVCALLLGFGYYLQYAQGLEPCPLCLVQRGFFYAVMAIFIAAAAQNPGRTSASSPSRSSVPALAFICGREASAMTTTGSERGLPAAMSAAEIACASPAPM